MPQAHLASECWRAVYFRLGATLLVPMLLLALLLLEGGANELGAAAPRPRHTRPT